MPDAIEPRSLPPRPPPSPISHRSSCNRTLTTNRTSTPRQNSVESKVELPPPHARSGHEKTTPVRMLRHPAKRHLDARWRLMKRSRGYPPSNHRRHQSPHPGINTHCVTKAVHVPPIRGRREPLNLLPWARRRRRKVRRTK